MADSKLIKEGTVCRLNSLGDDPRLSKRLMEMGVMTGMTVSITRTGVLGGPMAIALEDGQSIAIRPSELKGLDWTVVATPLSVLDRPREGLSVYAIRAGKALQQRMEEQGLRPGMACELVSAKPIRLRLEDGKEVSIGRGEASKLIMQLDEGLIDD